MKGSFAFLLVVLGGVMMWRHADGPGAASDTALSAAVEAGDVEAVRRHLHLGGVDGTSEIGIPLLGLAAWHGQRHVMRALMDEFDFDVNARSPTGWSPLMMAVLGGQADVVEMLLSAGADAGAATDTGATALSIAIDRDYEEIVERLLSAHARYPQGANESRWAACHP